MTIIHPDYFWKGEPGKSQLPLYVSITEIIRKAGYTELWMLMFSTDKLIKIGSS